MSLQQLDAFLRHAQLSAPLQEQLRQPLDLSAFLRLASSEGFCVEEADVLEAQQREESHLSDAELQHRAGAEACRLRNFIHG